MADLEELKLGAESVTRRLASVISPTLLTMPAEYMPPEVACANCPMASSYFADDLTCHCTARHDVSWKPKDKSIAHCDEREAALAEIDAARKAERERFGCCELDTRGSSPD